MNRRKFIKLGVLAGSGIAVLFSGTFLIPRIFIDRDEKLAKEVRELWSKYTPITLGEVIEKQNLQEVNLAVPVYDNPYDFKTPQGSFSIVLSRCYNFSNEKLFDGNHAVWFDYSNLGGKFRKTTRRIETIIEEDPLIGESAESLYSFCTKNAHALRDHIKQICLPGETQKFDGFLGDLEKLVKEDRFSVDKPFEAVLINNYHPSCVQDAPNKLDEEIRARLLSSNNQFTYVSPEEIERLNKIFESMAQRGEIDIKKSSFDDTMLFYLKTLTKHFRLYKGDDWYDEEKNKLVPSFVLSNSEKLEVTCAPPALFLARMINYANEVNPNFKYIYALATGITDFKEGQKERAYSRHVLVGVVDTENKKISFLNPFLLVALSLVTPNMYNAIQVKTSYRKDIMGYLPGGEITSDGTSGLNLRQFLEESKRNLKRKY